MSAVRSGRWWGWCVALMTLTGCGNDSESSAPATPTEDYGTFTLDRDVPGVPFVAKSCAAEAVEVETATMSTHFITVRAADYERRFEDFRVGRTRAESTQFNVTAYLEDAIEPSIPLGDYPVNGLAEQRSASAGVTLLDSTCGGAGVSADGRSGTVNVEVLTANRVKGRFSVYFADPPEPEPLLGTFDCPLFAKVAPTEDECLPR